MPDRAPTRPIPGAEQLLERLDPLPVPDQRAFVVRLAREHAADPGLAALIEDWAGAGTFQRRWAAVMATETGATRPLEPLLSDPSPLVRHAAVTGWLRLAEQRPELAERLAVHVDRWPRSARERFPTSVRWQRRPRVAAALVSWAWERYDEVAIHLLRWCDADTVARMLPEVGLVDPLVARHPELVARYLHDHPGVLSEEWGATWGYGTRELSAAFLERRPDLLPPLVDRHTPDTLPPGLVACVPRLLAALPEWTLRRLGDPETMRRLTADWPSAALGRALAAASDDVVARFLTLARPYPQYVRMLALREPGEPRDAASPADRPGAAAPASAADQPGAAAPPAVGRPRDPAGWPRELGERLAADPAAIRDPRARFLLARKHTELLDHLLSPEASRYASAAELAGWLLELTYQRQAWTPRRQRQFADRVTALMPDAVADRGVPVRQRCRLLRRYAALPQVAGGDLVPWLERAPADRSGSLRAPRHSWPRSESEDLLLAQAALYGLLRSPDPEPALRYVLRHLIDTPLWLDPTASALTARRMPPARLRALLSELLPRARHRVARWHLLRLIGEAEVEGTAELLLAAWRTERQPRLRRTIVESAQRLLDDETAWSVLDSAAATLLEPDGTAPPPDEADEAALERALGRLQPSCVPERHRPRFARLMWRLAVGHRFPLQVSITWWLDAAPDLVAELAAELADPSRPADWLGPRGHDVLALLGDRLPDALAELSRSGTDPQGLAAVRLRELVAAVSAPGSHHDGGALRHGPVLQRAADVLDGDPCWRTEVALLRLAAVPLGGEDTDATVRALVTLARQVHDTAPASDELTRWLRRQVGAQLMVGPAHWRPIAGGLAASAEPVARGFAAAINSAVAAAREGPGMPP